jgi:hypothetical protein
MARAKKKDEPKQRTITRKVFFYRVNAGVETDTGKARQVNFGPAVKHLDTLPFTTDGRYLDTDDGKQLCCWSDSQHLPYRFRLANIRRGQHPPVENGGVFSPLVLGAGRGLAEITHLVLFADGVFGAEFNFYGPRASQLSFYFALKLRDLCPAFRLASIARPDLEARLAALSDIKLLDIKMRASFASILQDADEDLGAALNANIKAVGARPEDEFELKFMRKKSKSLISRAMPASLIDGVRKLARRPDLKEQVSIFKVAGVAGSESHFVDILHEQFTAEKAIQPAAGESGGVDSESMFVAIEAAYAEIQAQLSTASDLG